MYFFGFLLLGFAFAIQESQYGTDFLQFKGWMKKHGKVYATEEETAHKFNNWKASVQRIASKTGSQGATFALNKFSDLSVEEFKAQYLIKDFRPTPEEEREYFPEKNFVAPVPSKFDWRAHGKVTPVKNQKQCGSCWAFSTVENIESVWMIAKKITNSSMEPLSVQQIVDCDGKDGGCNGGDTPTAYHYVMHAGGLETEKDYPYKAVDEKCHFEKSKIYAHISGWKYAAKKGDEVEMHHSLFEMSPLSICLDAENWQDYSHGVMTAAQCAKHVTLDHCVQVVGIDLSAAHPHWIVRNSWGKDWGVAGFIMLEYGHNTCGLTDEVTTAFLRL